MPAVSAVGKSSRARVGCLVYPPLRAKRADNSFLGNGNVGMRVVVECLERAGMAVEFCDVWTADRFDVVLVSFTSSFDVIAFRVAVARLQWWHRPRRFKVVAGGAGLVNPVSVRDFLDFAVFGRCEDWITWVIDSILSGRSVVHGSVMCLPEIHRVTMGQASRLYRSAWWREPFIGCPHACRFCLYRWSRKLIGGRSYRNTALMQSSGAAPEIMFRDLLQGPRPAGRIRVAVDGCSERLRRSGKGITDGEIVAAIEHAGSWGGPPVVLLVYNIGNMPGETEWDRAELERVFSSARPKHRVIVVLHTTPFRPSACTPMQWDPVSLDPDWSQVRNRLVCETGSLRVVHSMRNETPWSHLLTMLVERASPATEHLLPAALALKGRDLGKVGRFPYDLTDILRAYVPGEPAFPLWWLSSYTPAAVVRGLAVR